MSLNHSSGRKLSFVIMHATYYINIATEIGVGDLSPSQSVIHCDVLLVRVATVHCILAEVAQCLGCHATE